MKKSMYKIWAVIGLAVSLSVSGCGGAGSSDYSETKAEEDRVIQQVMESKPFGLPHTWEEIFSNYNQDGSTWSSYNQDGLQLVSVSTEVKNGATGEERTWKVIFVVDDDGSIDIYDADFGEGYEDYTPRQNVAQFAFNAVAGLDGTVNGNENPAEECLKYISEHSEYFTGYYTAGLSDESVPFTIIRDALLPGCEDYMAGLSGDVPDFTVTSNDSDAEMGSVDVFIPGMSFTLSFMYGAVEDSIGITDVIWVDSDGAARAADTMDLLMPWVEDYVKSIDEEVDMAAAAEWAEVHTLFGSMDMAEMDREFSEKMMAELTDETDPASEEEYETAGGIEDEAYYLLPESSERYLTMADLSGMDYSSLRIAKNEIYARHGRMFTSEDLDSYFGQQSWYSPSIPADQFTDDMLTEIEKKNVELINNAMSEVEGTDKLVSVQDTTGDYASRGLTVNDSIAIPQMNGIYEYSAANGNFVIAAITNGVFEFTLYDSEENKLDGCFNMLNVNDTEYDDESGYYGAWFDSYGSVLHLDCMGEQTDYTFKSFDPS